MLPISRVSPLSPGSWRITLLSGSGRNRDPAFRSSRFQLAFYRFRTDADVIEMPPGLPDVDAFHFFAMHFDPLHDYVRDEEERDIPPDNGLAPGHYRASPFPDRRPFSSSRASRSSTRYSRSSIFRRRFSMARSCRSIIAQITLRTAFSTAG